jgi:outer membrane protein assembly factor BamB
VALPVALLLLAIVALQMRSFVLSKMPESVARVYVHTMIRAGLDDHDFMVSLYGKLANKDSIPILIAALTSSEYAMGCGCGSPLKSLNRLTNCAPGNDRASWEKWWETNRNKSLEQIKADSVQEIGLQPGWSKGEDSARLLMRALAHEQEHWRTTASGALETFPEANLLAARDACVKSDVAEERLGAIEWIAQFRLYDHVQSSRDDTEHDGGATTFSQSMESEMKKEEEILRTLSEDPVQEVRAKALRALNKQLATTIPPNETQEVIQEQKFGDRIYGISEGGDPSRVLVRFSVSLYCPNPGSVPDLSLETKLASYNLDTGEVDWEYLCSNTVLSTPLINNNHLFVYCRDRIVALELSTGEEVWGRNVDSGAGKVRGEKTLLQGDRVILNTTDALMALSQDDGEVLWRVTLDGVRKKERHLENGNIGYTNSHFFVATHDDRLLKVDHEGLVVAECSLLPQAIEGGSTSRDYYEGAFGVAAQNGAIYSALLLNGAAHCRAHSAETLEELWSTTLPNRSRSGELFLIGDKMLCTSAHRGWCVDTNTGAIMWMEGGGWSSYGLEFDAISTNYFVAYGRDCGSVVRRVSDGEVVTDYSEAPPISAQYVIMHEKGLVTGHKDGRLSLVKMPGKTRTLAEGS